MNDLITILIVEDEPLTRDAISHIIRDYFSDGDILFVSIAVYGTVKCFRGETDEEGSPAEKEAAVQPQGKAEKWTCAYCKTTVDGDSAFCPACGAGRKGKQ